MIYFICESAAEQCVAQADVTDAVASAFRAMATGQAQSFPVVRQALGYADAVFGFKSGFDASAPVLGVKAGGLWPANRDRGLANHQSTILLCDPDSGQPQALVCGTHLTGLRTAAASALSIRYLARDDARTLGVLGAGGQADFQVRAAVAERRFERVLVASRRGESAQRLRESLTDLAVAVEVCDPQALCEQSDVIITVALSFAPILDAAWIRPGTHLACMGTDTRGKQEVDAQLFRACAAFGDVPEQNATLGECRHAVDEGWLTSRDIVPLGRVLSAKHPGRTRHDEITLFDSTGVGLQDLAAARVALDKAIAAGAAIPLDPRS
ncbi:MAG: ornithine cyclodeaminase family protein [Pseudomonadota bacterium]